MVAQVLQRAARVGDDLAVLVVEARQQPVLAAALPQQVLRQVRLVVDGVGREVGEEEERLLDDGLVLLGEEPRAEKKSPWTSPACLPARESWRMPNHRIARKKAGEQNGRRSRESSAAGGATASSAKSSEPVQ